MIVARWSLREISSSLQSHLSPHDQTNWLALNLLRAQSSSRSSPGRFEHYFQNSTSPADERCPIRQRALSCEATVNMKPAFQYRFAFINWSSSDRSEVTSPAPAAAAGLLPLPAPPFPLLPKPAAHRGEKSPFVPSKRDLAGGNRPTCGEQVQSESAGTNSSTSFHPASCRQDEKTSRHHVSQ